MQLPQCWVQCLVRRTRRDDQPELELSRYIRFAFVYPRRCLSRLAPRFGMATNASGPGSGHEDRRKKPTLPKSKCRGTFGSDSVKCFDGKEKAIIKTQENTESTKPVEDEHCERSTKRKSLCFLMMVFFCLFFFLLELFI